MSKKGRELSRFAAPAARFSHVDWMRGRKSSPRASSSRTCAYGRVAVLMRENESKSAGDRVCPANRKPRRKVKKRKKRGGALAHATREKRASNKALRRFCARTEARYANCFRPGRTLHVALYAQYVQFATRSVAYVQVSFTMHRCSTWE